MNTLTKFDLLLPFSDNAFMNTDVLDLLLSGRPEGLTAFDRLYLVNLAYKADADEFVMMRATDVCRDIGCAHHTAELIAAGLARRGLIERKKISSCGYSRIVREAIE
jgi:hypothetical protein